LADEHFSEIHVPSIHRLPTRSTMTQNAGLAWPKRSTALSSSRLREVVVEAERHVRVVGMGRTAYRGAADTGQLAGAGVRYHGEFGARGRAVVGPAALEGEAAGPVADAAGNVHQADETRGAVAGVAHQRFEEGLRLE